jgi:hypothetical protein
MKTWKSIGLLATVALLGLTPAAQAFDTGPHQDLTNEVLAELGFNTDANRSVQLENWLTDYYSNSPTVGKEVHKDLEKLHFDGLTNSLRIDHYWQRLTANTKAAVQGAAREKNALKLLSLMGISLHAVQDFYTHSNWVETHPAPQGYDYATVTWFDTKKRDGVKTGRYPNAKPIDGAHDHGDYNTGINHDSQSRPEFHRAYVFAYAASRQWVHQIQAWVNEVDPDIWKAAQNINLSESDRAALGSGLNAAYRVSEWVTASGNDGHWKGKGSGATAAFAAASASWVASPGGSFVKHFRDDKWYQLLSGGQGGAQNLADDAKSSVEVPDVAHIPIKKQLIVVRGTEIKELPVGLFESKIDTLGTADFYAKITIDGMTLLENTYQDKERVVDPWDTFKFVDDSKERVDIHIEVWDEDVPKTSTDDHCDINPGDKDDLDMTLNTRNQELSGDIRGIFDNHDKPWGEGGNKKNRAFLKAYCRSRKLADLPPDNDEQTAVSVTRASAGPGIFSLLALGLVGGVVAKRR